MTAMNLTATTENLVEPHEPHWVSRAAFPIVSGAFVLAESALAIMVHYSLIWLAVPLVLVVSHLMHGQLIGFHEASHGLLRKNRHLNDVDGILIGTFSFMSFTLYRAIHQTHHMHLSTARDEELWPFVHTESPRWLRMLAAFLELTIGLIFSPCIFLRAFLRAGSPVRSRKVRQRIWAEYVLGAIAWIAVLSAVAWWGVWKYFLWMYLAPAYLAANLQSWRKYIEHVGLTGSTINGCTRNIVADDWIGRLVAFTLLHEPYHGVHHLHAGLRHAELPRHASELAPAASGERCPYPSYGHALWDLLRSLANPRVGAQWHAASSP
jgi:fatty acid desaturase